MVHELCHLKELNHGAQFWREVEAVLPQALTLARTLRHFERTQGTAVPTLKDWTLSHTECAHCVNSENYRHAVFVPPESESSQSTVR